jgi:hypothetical protein
MTKTAQLQLTFSTCAANTTAVVNSGTAALYGVSGFATISTAVGRAERKLVGVAPSEINPAVVNRQRDQQYA